MTQRIVQHPLFWPLIAAFVARMAAATLGSGYLMHDDHFLVFEVAASWADGEDYNNWLPWNQGDIQSPRPGNFAYPSTQYVVFLLMDALGMEHPADQALALRMLHGLYSLTIIVLGYLLARALGPDDHKAANVVAWMLSIGGLWPLLSVHQLVEVVCIPPLMLGLWALARHAQLSRKDLLLAGIGIGLATGLRYQCGVIGLGLVPILLIERRLRDLIAVGTVALLTFTLVQSTDLFVWGRPFVQLGGYINYNMANAGNYTSGPWYQYLLTLAGLLIPPVSLMLLWGTFHRRRAAAQWWRVAIPVLCFLLFHSLFVNKQERFILPIVPAVIALGAVGWNLWSQQSHWWQRNQKLDQLAWSAFWVISLGLLAVTIPYSGKQTRVQAMHFLYEQGASEFAMIQVDSGAMPPQFYSGSWNSYHIDNRRESRRDPIAVAKSWCIDPPQFLLFQGDRHLGEAVAEYKAAMPDLRYVTTIKPSRIDRWLHEINPINSVERIMVYSTEGALPCP